MQNNTDKIHTNEVYHILGSLNGLLFNPNYIIEGNTNIWIGANTFPINPVTNVTLFVLHAIPHWIDNNIIEKINNFNLLTFCNTILLS